MTISITKCWKISLLILITYSECREHAMPQANILYQFSQLTRSVCLLVSMFQFEAINFDCVALRIMYSRLKVNSLMNRPPNQNRNTRRDEEKKQQQRNYPTLQMCSGRRAQLTSVAIRQHLWKKVKLRSFARRTVRLIPVRRGKPKATKKNVCKMEKRRA